MKKSCIRIYILLLLCVLPLQAQAAQVLEDGAAGETVMVLTRRLSELGYIAQSVDVYSEEVVSAVGDFQTANGLERTGVADIMTQQTMNSPAVVTRQSYIQSFSNRFADTELSVGSSGDPVKRMQSALAELGYYSGSSDGKFGEGTRRAVVNFQNANGLEPTGEADESLMLRLYEGAAISYDEYVRSQCAVRGNSGANVRSIQRRLIELGYYTGDPTGTYGDNTTRAVSRFQYDNGISQSGDVDSVTYEALFSQNAGYAEDDGSLYPGDSGDPVFGMQQQLAHLGFYLGEPDGEYDNATGAAVMLFRAANGFAVSENADLEVLGALYSGNAVGPSVLDGAADDIAADDMARICEAVRVRVGESFGEHDGLFPGFGLVRYAYAVCGAAIDDPSNVLANLMPYDGGDVVPGSVMALERTENDAKVMYLAIYAGSDSVVWINARTGLAETVAIDDTGYTAAYVWQTGGRE